MSLKDQSRHRALGFSFVEVLVTVGVLGIMTVASLAMFTNLLKAQKYLSVKSQVNMIVSSMQMAMGNVSACTESLQLEKTPIKVRRTELPGQTGSSQTVFVYELDRLNIPGNSVLKVGEVSDGISLDSARLEFHDPIVKPDGLDYIADLKFETSNPNPGTQIGPKSFLNTLRVYASFVDSGDGTNLRMQSCYMKAGLEDPKTSCIDMGGRWLEATAPPAYMPAPRCNFGADIVLSKNELPDAIPYDGGVNANLERVEECYTLNKGVVSPYLCQSLSGATSGNRCVFDTALRKWQVRYFSNGVMTASVSKQCDKGVKISIRAPTMAILQWNQRLYTLDQATPYADNWPDNEFSPQEQTRFLHLVDKCKTDPDKDLYSNCGNGGDPSAALRGKAGTCIYVKGIKVTNTSTTMARITSCGARCAGMDPLNYTGWILVDPYYPRKLSADAATGRTIVTEARGTPCYEAIIGSGEPATNLKDILNAQTPTAAYTADPTLIQQCVIYGYSSKAAGVPSRSQILTCDNTTMVTSDLDAIAGEGAYTQTSLLTNGCWHFTNTKVSGYFSTPTYTGWVFMTRDLKDNAYKLDHTTYSLAPATGGSTINAIPCAGRGAAYSGVRTAE